MARPRPPLPGQQAPEAPEAPTEATPAPAANDQACAPDDLDGFIEEPQLESAAAPDEIEDAFSAEPDPITRGYLRQIAAEPFGYLCGDAGTGKSYLARRFAELSPTGQLVATTGIAAVNLGGTTINSLLRYYDTQSMQLEYEYGRLAVSLRQLASSGVTRLIIDEISMMDGNQLDVLSLALNDVNEPRRQEGKEPIGVWLTGDFAQLPPVGADGKAKKKPGAVDGPPPIYAFESPAWSTWASNVIKLTKIHRQADPDFIKAIQQLRTGDKTCTDYFRQFIHPTEISEFDGTTILAKNDEVDRYNNLRMLRLQAQEDTFTAIRGGTDPGKCPSEWKNIPDTLRLKPGCLVMILANRRDRDTKEMLYVNGDLGTYLQKMSAGTARVRLHRTGEDVYVQVTLREHLKPGTPRTARQKEVTPPEYVQASIVYMPLRVAYASTVHKSQGLSLDNVQVLINSQFWMSSGMLYVGISRARSPQGLRIVGTPEQFAARVRTNSRILQWI